MEEVNASLRGERKDEIKKDSHGIAMANIKRRFELSFGEGVEVLLKEKEGNTVATIRFPKGKENNNDSRLPN
jgi:LytS/YehU family sensor histidine kinase